MKWRHTEEQIIGFLLEADAGLPVKELCRKHGFSKPSYYAGKATFGGMNVSDAQRLKALEAENTKSRIYWATRCSRSTRWREVLQGAVTEAEADSCGLTACEETLRTAMTVGADRAIQVEITEKLRSTVFANQAFGFRKTSMDTHT